MTSAPWQPLADREAGIPPKDTLYEGVPPHLEQPLRQWTQDGLLGGGAEQVALRLRLRIDPERDSTGGIDTLTYDPRTGIELLTVIDAMLDLGGPWPRRHSSDITGTGQQYEARVMRTQLGRLLDDGSSVWRVDGKRLTRRSSAVSAAAYDQARASAQFRPDAGSADKQLTLAWDTLHALHPNPPEAYRQAIRAVESAAHAIIEPNNPRATMGTMIGQMTDNPARYKLAIPGPDGSGNVAPVIAMMKLLWQGQTSRHGSQTPARHETPDEARMAVHLAITLVEWFTTGAVQRTP